MSAMPKLKPVIVQMRVSAEDRARIAEVARRENRTVSAWLRNVASRALEAKQARSNKLETERGGTKGTPKRTRSG